MVTTAIVELANGIAEIQQAVMFVSVTVMKVVAVQLVVASSRIAISYFTIPQKLAVTPSTSGSRPSSALEDQLKLSLRSTGQTRPIASASRTQKHRPTICLCPSSIRLKHVALLTYTGFPRLPVWLPPTRMTLQRHLKDQASITLIGFMRSVSWMMEQMGS